MSVPCRSLTISWFFFFFFVAQDHPIPAGSLLETELPFVPLMNTDHFVVIFLVLIREY